MDYFQDKADKKHELEIMTRQAEIQLDKTAIDANIREVESIHAHDASLDGVALLTLFALVYALLLLMFLWPSLLGSK